MHRRHLHLAVRQADQLRGNPRTRPSREATHEPLRPLLTPRLPVLPSQETDVLSNRCAACPTALRATTSNLKPLVRRRTHLRCSSALREHIPYGTSGLTSLQNRTDQRFRWSASWGSPPPESNRRPHPYHGSVTKRRAIPRLRRSTDTVDVTVMGSVTSWSRARAGFESSTFHQRRLIQTLTSWVWGSEVLVESAGPVSGGGFLASAVRASSASWVSSSLSRMAKGSARSRNGTSGVRRRTPRTEWRTPEGIRGRRSATAARVPPDHTRVGRARWPARASVRSDGAGVGLDVGEHAAAVPAREGPYEP
jgi:hypothetical protein